MTALWIAVLTFALVFGGAIVGTNIRALLPKHHLEDDSRDAVKVVVALTATLAAVLVSLLISSAKNFYDSQTAEVQQVASRVILLDRILSIYGPEAAEARLEFRNTVAAAVEKIWPTRTSDASNLALPQGRAAPDAFLRRILELTPHTDPQRVAQAQAIQVGFSLAEIRFLISAQSGNTVPALFLAVLLFWVVVLFGGYGLLTRINGTMVAVLLFSALSIASAIYLIVEFNHPFDGVIRIPDTIMRDALAQMEHS